MSVSAISFTRNGSLLMVKLCRRLRENGVEAEGWLLPKFSELSGGSPDHIHLLELALGPWTKMEFNEKNSIIFVGAVGIAVRAIAPFVTDKLTDPAVVAVDEKGRFSIPLLSGHMGGGNRLALTVAKLLGATPVITTATDLNGRFAVDVFAWERGLAVTDREKAKKISADILEGKPVGFFCDFHVEGELPDGLARDVWCEANIWITVALGEEELPGWSSDRTVLRLVPPAVVAGIGCRRGVKQETIRRQVEKAALAAKLSLESIGKVASIDLKKEEKGLVDFAAERGIPLVTFSAKRLEKVEGEYSESEFVRRITGTGNVCQRAAMAAGGRRLAAGKFTGEGVTVALAVGDWKLEMKS